MNNTKPLAIRIVELREAQRVALAVGVPALSRLFALAEQSDSRKARRIAAFLAGLYNGPRYKFDLTDLRGLGPELVQDCLAVLHMDALFCEREVHRYFENGGVRFEEMITNHHLRGGPASNRDW